MVNAVNILKDQYRIPCTVGTASLDCAYSSFKRWNGRFKKNLPVIRKPGPKKIEPLDYAELEEEINNLKHCRKRSKGFGILYQRYNNSISRRELAALVSTTRKEINRNNDEKMKRVLWLQSNVAWGIDDTQESAHKNIHNIRDMCSKYQFRPLTGKLPSGKEVADHLKDLFEKHGVPLVLKRDNGPNLKSREVRELLEEYMVIPLDSPFYYPKYNGSVEHGQGEMKRILAESGPLRLRAELAAHDMNHKNRPCLGNRVSCQVFWQGKVKFNKRERKEVFLWIRERQLAILAKVDEINERAIMIAWRVSVESWLQLKGHITVHRGRKCYQVLEKKRLIN